MLERRPGRSGGIRLGGEPPYRWVTAGVVQAAHHTGSKPLRSDLEGDARVLRGQGEVLIFGLIRVCSGFGRTGQPSDYWKLISLSTRELSDPRDLRKLRTIPVDTGAFMIS